MRIAMVLSLLMLGAMLSGCLGGEDREYSDFEGCTTDEEISCEIVEPIENQTANESNPPMYDLIYARPNGVALRLAVHLPNTDGPHPVIMYIHEGEWKSGTRELSEDHAARQLVKKEGWAVISVEYRLSNEGIWPAQLEDLETALYWINNNSDTYNLDINTTVVWGSGAGGHLAAMLAVNSNHSISAAIDWFGPTDLVEMVEISNATGSDYSSISDLIGCDPMNGSECTNQTMSASPVHLTTGSTVPMLIMHGTDDEDVPHNQSLSMSQSLSTPRWMVTIEGGGHGAMSHPWKENMVVQIVADFLENVTSESVQNRQITVDAGPETGTWEGQRVHDVQTLARPPGGPWQDWRLSDYLVPNWNNNTNDPWIVIQFLSTDCSHCWNAADDIEVLHNQYKDSIILFSFAVNFSSNNNFNASLSEIGAFQDRTSYQGCYYSTRDCADRPGPAHNWTYVDDRDQTQMYAFHSQGTPMYVIIQPDGIISWHQYQNDGQSVADALAELFPGDG